MEFHRDNTVLFILVPGILHMPPTLVNTAPMDQITGLSVTPIPTRTLQTLEPISVIANACHKTHVRAALLAAAPLLLQLPRPHLLHGTNGQQHPVR
jgi:hypothetical protein